MTTHRWTHGTPLVRHNTGERIEKGDLFEASEHELRAFGDRIEEVEETEDADEGEDDEAGDVAGSDESDGSDGPEDVDEWHNWNEDAWLDLDYEQRAEDVLEGRVDEHLDDIEDVETSKTVESAVDDRRAELEGEA